MIKKLLIFLWTILIFLTTWVAFYLFYNIGDNVQQKDISYYEDMWKQTFLNYQNTKFEIKDKWIFDFQVWFEAEWDVSNLKNMLEKSWVVFDGDFKKLSVKIFWDYDFSSDQPKLNLSLKVYLNKQELWLWDLDIKTNIWLNKSTYYLNNLDRKLLSFLSVEQSTADILMNMYDENKWKEMLLPLPDWMFIELINAVKSSSNDSPLYKNTDSQEKRIIESFLKNDVLEILSWKTENMSDKIEFSWNSDNFVEFMNNVSEIINTGNSQVNFDSEKELLKNLKIRWVMDIKDKLIINSTILSEILISAIDSETNQNKYEPISVVSNLKMPTPSKIDFDWSTSFVAASSPNNKIKLRIKWLIK